MECKRCGGRWTARVASPTYCPKCRSPYWDKAALKKDGESRQGLHFNALTPDEAERLALLSEECGEVIQVIGKILRHGYESCHPKGPLGLTNRRLLETEIGDVGAAVELLVNSKDLNEDSIIAASHAKSGKVKEYLHHQGGER